MITTHEMPTFSDVEYSWSLTRASRSTDGSKSEAEDEPKIPCFN